MGIIGRRKALARMLSGFCLTLVMCLGFASMGRGQDAVWMGGLVSAVAVYGKERWDKRHGQWVDRKGLMHDAVGIAAGCLLAALVILAI